MGQSVLWVLLLFACCCSAQHYKILVAVPFPAVSHFNLGKAVADILHMRGHEVTIISTFPSKKPAYREIIVSELNELKNDNTVNFHMSKQSKIETTLFLTNWVPMMMDKALQNKDVQKLLKDKSEHFDLVVVEYFLNEILFGLGVRFDCPVAAISPVTMMHWLARNSGNPTSPATVPNIFLSFLEGMNLVERTLNTLMGIFQDIVGWAILDKNHAAIYAKHFPEEAAKVDFQTVKRSLSLVYVNSHPSLGIARPFLPNAVEIGGYHIGLIQPLQEDLQKILDNAKDGVIFFSMGSNLKSSKLPDDIKKAILKSLSKLKQTVLWKFEEDLPGKPKNVVIKSWLPQTSILAHPNVKLFITHGGLLSTTEAASAGVPMLVIPIFGDQHHNARATERRGNGLVLDFANVTETSLTWVLNELLSNPKYDKEAKKINRLFHDRPMNPRDLVTFYAEHVIRSGGAKHLTPPDLSMFSSLLLDVALVLLLPLIVLFSLIVCIWKKCCKRTPKDKGKPAKKEKQKKN